MKQQLLSQLIPLVIFTAIVCPLIAEKPAPTSQANMAITERSLNTAGAKMVQVRDGLQGPTHTQIFLILAEQHAVVRLLINHTSQAFTTTGNVILFAAGTNEEEIGKWINNQHSCALHMDVPKPLFTGKLPDDSCTVVESKKVALRAGPVDHAPYHDYWVKLNVKGHKEPGKYALAAFPIEADVYLKINDDKKNHD